MEREIKVGSGYGPCGSARRAHAKCRLRRPNCERSAEIFSVYATRDERGSWGALARPRTDEVQSGLQRHAEFNRTLLYGEPGVSYTHRS